MDIKIKLLPRLQKVKICFEKDIKGLGNKVIWEHVCVTIVNSDGFFGQRTKRMSEKCYIRNRRIYKKYNFLTICEHIIL